MNRSDVVNFFKAPFKERFLLACVLCLPILLATPFIFSFLKFIYTRTDSFSVISSSTIINDLWYTWFVGQDMMIITSAFFGGFLVFILSSGFIYMLGHAIVEQRGEIFDFKPVSISGLQIVIGSLKTISYIFWGMVYGILCIVALMLLPTLMLFIGTFLPSLFSVLLWISVVIIEIGLLLWMILNAGISNFRFLIHLKTRVWFQWRENYLYLKQYKGRLFLAWALCWVCGMIIQVLLKTSYSWIIKAGFFLEGNLLKLNVPQPNVVVMLGLLVTIAVTIYLSLLQMTFAAKSIVWLEQEQSETPTKNVTSKKVAHKKK